MALGKQTGDFLFKVNSTTYYETNAQINLRGTATGFGTVEGTLTLTGEPGATSGRVSFRGASFLDDGRINNAGGEGTWTTVGKHKWRIRGFTYVDQQIIITDGELELATQTYQGKLYEWN
jgi:hypothetical protein